MSNTNTLELMNSVEEFLQPMFFNCLTCTKDDFEKNRSKFSKEGNVIVISDTGEELIYANHDFVPVGTIGGEEKETRHREIKKCKCSSCNATLDLSNIPESGAIKCSYCGNWNLIYEG